MRADRLIATLMILQTRGRLTAAELAEELEISVRTARRDLEALAMSGVPIYSQPGRGGGWRLIGGAKTDLTGLSADESRALFVALAPQGEGNPVLEAALRKLLVAVPEGFRDEAVAASAAIRVDPTGWGQIGPTYQPEYVDVLSEAVISGRQINMRYETPGKQAANRIVHPLGLVTKRGVWYLVGNTSSGIRTFRLSRVQAVALLDEPVDRPDDFDLEATWESIVTTMESRRNKLVVRAIAEPYILTPLRYVFSNRIDIKAELDDGRFEVDLADVSVEAFVAQIVGFGTRLELVDPSEEIVAEITRLVADLASVWLDS